MNTNGVRAAIYLRVSRDDQTTENQRLVLARVAEHRGWLIVQTYEDQGISGAKGRDQRRAFDAMLKDAVQRRYDILLVWSIDRLGAGAPNTSHDNVEDCPSAIEGGAAVNEEITGACAIVTDAGCD
jgi:DNA invertase Pin-like site-specific DNA recombinase